MKKFRLGSPDQASCLRRRPEGGRASSRLNWGLQASRSAWLLAGFPCASADSLALLAYLANCSHTPDSQACASLWKPCAERGCDGLLLCSGCARRRIEFSDVLRCMCYLQLTFDKHRVSACLLQVKTAKPIILRCCPRAAFGQTLRFAMWSASCRTLRSAMAGGFLGLLRGSWRLWLCLSCSCQSVELGCCCALAARMRAESKNPNSCCNPHVPDAPFCVVSSRPHPTNTSLYNAA